MSLITRMLVFFQVALAVILLAFCLVLYAAAHLYLHHQADESVERAVATLVASVDIEPDSVEWEPTDRDVSLGPGPLGGTIHWSLTDARGQPVDQSPGPVATELITITGAALVSAPDPAGWLVSRRLVHPPGATDAQLTRNRTAEEVEKGEYPALVFTVGVQTGPIRTALNTLAIGLGSVSIVVWLAALTVGRWVCRRALRPVTEMAAAAREMRAEDADSRLPPSGARGELEELHVAISGLLDRLRAALGRERRFTAEASHQLRTPLGTILGQVEVALRRPRPPEEYERVLAVVHRQAGQLTRAVESLLFLARSEADAHPPAMELIDLADWVPRFIASLADHRRASDLSFDLIPGGPFLVSAHPQLLHELVQNLIDNAFKHSPKATSVSIRLARSEDAVVLTVVDHGPGVPVDDVPRLFEPFFRSADARRRGIPGAGLGLAVVARIAAAFGARIGVTSPPGSGARFAVSFPVPAITPQDEEDFISPSRTV